MEVWSGGANYYTVAHITVGGVDAANSLMAVKHLVFDEKKLTMAELKKALAANFEGEYEKVGKMCYGAPKHGNDIPEVNELVRRVYDSNFQAFQNVGGNYIGKDIKSAPDAYTKSIHNYLGLMTGALPKRQKNQGCTHRWKCVRHARNRYPWSDRAGRFRSEGHRRGEVHLGAHEHEAPAGQLKNRKGRETC